MITPRLSKHARGRCLEMGVRTKRVKNLVRHPSIVRPAGDGKSIAVSDDDPEIAVVFEGNNPPWVVTVLWRTYEEYERKGTTWSSTTLKKR